MSEKKKIYFEMPNVREFISEQPEEVRKEYGDIAKELERNGFLTMPTGEKIQGENLFAIRVIQTANIRVFYVYGKNDLIFGLYGYVKKTQQIPTHELRHARKMVKQLKLGGQI